MIDAERVTRSVTRRVLRALDHPLIWDASRAVLDLLIGLYRRRIDVMTRWGVLSGEPSVLDVGCGTGRYSQVTTGDYFGVDLDEDYIAIARRRNRRSNVTFQCASVATLSAGERTFDVVLMVDLLHHLDDETCRRLLGAAARLARGFVVSFEPIAEQTNFLGSWIVRHDRGKYVRGLADLNALFDRAPLTVVTTHDLYLGPIRTRATLCRPKNG